MKSPGLVKSHVYVTCVLTYCLVRKS